MNSSCCWTSHKETTATPKLLSNWRTTFRQEHGRTKASQELSHQVTIGWPNRHGSNKFNCKPLLTEIHHSSAPACWLHNILCLSPSDMKEAQACIGRWLPVWLCGLTLPKLMFVFTYPEVWTTCIQNSVLLDYCPLITSHKIRASSDTHNLFE